MHYIYRLHWLLTISIYFDLSWTVDSIQKVGIAFISTHMSQICEKCASIHFLLLHFSLPDMLHCRFPSFSSSVTSSSSFSFLFLYGILYYCLSLYAWFGSFSEISFLIYSRRSIFGTKFDSYTTLKSYIRQSNCSRIHHFQLHRDVTKSYNQNLGMWFDFPTSIHMPRIIWNRKHINNQN